MPLRQLRQTSHCRPGLVSWDEARRIAQMSCDTSTKSCKSRTTHAVNRIIDKESNRQNCAWACVPRFDNFNDRVLAATKFQPQ